MIDLDEVDIDGELASAIKVYPTKQRSNRLSARRRTWNIPTPPEKVENDTNETNSWYKNYRSKYKNDEEEISKQYLKDQEHEEFKQEENKIL